MPIARAVTERCLGCGDDSDVWVFEKEEGTGIKKCYSCESCGTEWSEMVAYSELDQ